MEVDVYSGDAGAVVPRSPLATSGADVGCVVNEDYAPTPSSGHRGSGGSGRPPKKTMGRKPSAKVGAVMEAEQNRGGLGAALVPVGAGAKAKRSKATPVAQRAPSVHAKAKLGDLSSLESAKLRTTDKNLEVSATGPGSQCP
ncbi:hypothetical protein VPH35_026611 [Triticum aestivum]